TVAFSDAARARLQESRGVLEQAIAAGEVIYGVNTGFGSLARQRVQGEQLREIQRNLILSHAAGVGEPLPEPVVRGMLCSLGASPRGGWSGVGPLAAHGLLDLLTPGIPRVVPSVVRSGPPVILRRWHMRRWY